MKTLTYLKSLFPEATKNYLKASLGIPTLETRLRKAKMNGFNPNLQNVGIKEQCQNRFASLRRVSLLPIHV